MRPALDPCGRACDWLRSCYTVPMLFDVTGSPINVVWYFVPPGTNFAPKGNQFVSGNWVSREVEAGDLGEQPGPRPWRNGSNPVNYPPPSGDPCSLDVKLQNGLDPGETTGPWTGRKLDCCSTPFDCLTLPSTLHVEITDLSGCGGIVGGFDIFTVAACVWQGGTPLFTLGYSMGAWFRFLNCSGGDPTWTQVSFSESPFELVFDVVDETGGALPAGCCSMSGLDRFRVTITLPAPPPASSSVLGDEVLGDIVLGN